MKLMIIHFNDACNPDILVEVKNNNKDLKHQLRTSRISRIVKNCL